MAGGIDYSRINGAHCILIGSEHLLNGTRRTWMLWSNGESTWGEFVDDRRDAGPQAVVILSHMVDSGHAPIPEHVDMQPPAVPMVANGPLPSN